LKADWCSPERWTFVHETARLLPHDARNRGAELAGGDVFVFTDPDCVAEPDWLERLLTHHANGRVDRSAACPTSGISRSGPAKAGHHVPLIGIGSEGD
jgi:glycosyltransferase involved in cell wall biosynthesis